MIKRKTDLLNALVNSDKYLIKSVRGIDESFSLGLSNGKKLDDVSNVIAKTVITEKLYLDKIENSKYFYKPTWIF
jgi:hypothetical protein